MFKSGMNGDGRLFRAYFDAALETDMTSCLPMVSQPVLLLYREIDTGFAYYRDQFHEGLPKSK